LPWRGDLTEMRLGQHRAKSSLCRLAATSPAGGCERAIERSAVDGRVRRSTSEAIRDAVAQWKSTILRQTRAQQKLA
jgi:hypothetical protein